MFKPAVKHESKLRLAIAGPSGSGKTYTALAIGTALGSKVAVVDTEHGSASKYADLFNFDVVEMHAPFHPNKYVEAIKVATEMGYDVVILDSLSHAWNGQGGLLEIVDDIAKRMKTSNTFAAWKDATPIQNSLVENMIGSGLHLIATMRSKQEYVMEQIERNGRTINQPKKVGMAPIQRDSMEYEFDVYMDMTIENDGIIQKTRCPALTGKVFSKPGADVAGILKEWLSGEPAPAPAVPKPRKVESNGVVVTDGKGNNEHNDIDPIEATKELNADNGQENEDLESAIITCRSWLEEKFVDGKTNLGMVLDAAAMTPLYSSFKHAHNALASDDGYEFPDGFKVNRNQQITGDGALKVYDWLMKRRAELAD